MYKFKPAHHSEYVMKYPAIPLHPAQAMKLPLVQCTHAVYTIQ